MPLFILYFDSIMLNIIVICIFTTAILASTLMKRSFYEKFPDYSLRYTYPNLCDTGTKQV